jgi:hypothetical protein
MAFPTGRDLKIKVLAKKDYETTVWGMTPAGEILSRSNYSPKYRFRGVISNEENRNLEWLLQWLVKKGWTIIEQEKEKKSVEPHLNQWEMTRLLITAQKAGLEAGNLHRPTPMYVVEHENPLDDNSPIKTAYPPVMGGVCGFAWVHFPRGNSRFVNFLKKKNLGHSGYPKGYDYWISDFGQSMEKKLKYAAAFSKVLNDAGIVCYAESRLD